MACVTRIESIFILNKWGGVSNLTFLTRKILVGLEIMRHEIVEEDLVIGNSE